MNKGNEGTPDKGKLRLINDTGQLKLESGSMDLQAGVVPGNEVMPSGRIETMDGGDIEEGSLEGGPKRH